jgi:hypothetical protein
LKGAGHIKLILHTVPWSIIAVARVADSAISVEDGVRKLVRPVLIVGTRGRRS